jgi:hypothetical protein
MSFYCGMIYFRYLLGDGGGDLLDVILVFLHIASVENAEKFI